MNLDLGSIFPTFKLCELGHISTYVCAQGISKTWRTWTKSFGKVDLELGKKWLNFGTDLLLNPGFWKIFFQFFFQIIRQDIFRHFQHWRQRFELYQCFLVVSVYVKFYVKLQYYKTSFNCNKLSSLCAKWDAKLAVVCQFNAGCLSYVPWLFSLSNICDYNAEMDLWYNVQTPLYVSSVSSVNCAKAADAGSR